MTGETHERILDLRSVFGVEARVTTPAEATGGAYVEMECTAEPGAGTIIHCHPEQEETFRIVEGALEMLQDGQWRTVRTGEMVSVPKGSVHGWRNIYNMPVRFLNVHRPALGFQAHLETLDRLVRAGKVRGMKDPRSLIYMSMSAVRYRPDVAVKPPQWVVNTLASLGRLLGFKLE